MCIICISPWGRHEAADKYKEQAMASLPIAKARELHSYYIIL